MSGFSGKVLLGDLNDFITPSVACTNPIFTEETQNTGSKIELSFDLDDPFPKDVKPDIIKTTVAKVATVSLNDCLACSGCVTSAETVLIQQHNTDEFVSVLQNNKDKLIVVCISQQSLVNLADYYHLEIVDCYKKLSTVLKQHHVDYVIDSSIGDILSQYETIEEYKKRSSSEQPARLPWQKEEASIAINKQMTIYPPSTIPIASLSNLTTIKDQKLLNDFHAKNYIHYFKDYVPSTLLPMITSSCPAIICYGEKTYPEVLPYFSTVKSAQQILATYLYDKLSFQYHKDIYIASVMSCFDKKLEASRGDFKRIDGEREVDCVLTSSELIEILNKWDVHLENIKEVIEPNEMECSLAYHWSPCSSDLSIPLQLKESNNALNALVDYLLQTSLVPLHLQWKQGKNSDFHEVHLLNDQNECVFKGCYVYGYRNLQTIIQKIKRGTCSYQFIELMACPKGCINGGGQMKTENDIHYSEMQTLFSTLSTLYEKNTRTPSEIYEEMKSFYHTSDSLFRELHTRYHISFSASFLVVQIRGFLYCVHHPNLRAQLVELVIASSLSTNYPFYRINQATNKKLLIIHRCHLCFNSVSVPIV